MYTLISILCDEYIVYHKENAFYWLNFVIIFTWLATGICAEYSTVYALGFTFTSLTKERKGYS